MNGSPKASAASVPNGIADVETAATTSASGYFSSINLDISTFTKFRTSIYDNMRRLSLYMGEFQPEPQTKGISGCNFTALISSNLSARRRSGFFIISL